MALFYSFILLLACGICAQAQKIDYRKSYYPLVNQAEDRFMEGRFAEAAHLYLAAFDAVPSGFAKDLHNAAVCATYAGMEGKAIQLLESLMLKGVSADYLQARKQFQPLRHSQAWGLLMQQAPRLRIEHMRQSLLPIAKELEWRVAQEQYFMLKDGYEAYSDTLTQIRSNNLQRFLQICKDYGFPAEDLIGTESPSAFPTWHTLVSQHCQMASLGLTNGLADFPKIQQECRYGKLLPHLYASYADQQGQNLYGTRAFFRFPGQKTLRQFKLSDAAMKRIDKQRSAIGLESLARYKAKVIFALQNEAFIFPYPNAITTFQGLSTAEIQEILADSEEVGPY